MAGDFEPIIIDMPGRTIRVWAVGDTHIGSPQFMRKEFRQFVDRVVADDDSFVVLVGDIIDNAINSGKCPAPPYGGSPYAQIDEAVELLKPLADRGKILAAVSGNHEQRTFKAVNIDVSEIIMCKLNLAHVYRKNLAFLRIVLKNGGVQDTYNFLLAHGSSANRRKNFFVSGVDCIVTGHTHAPSVDKTLTYLSFTQKGRVVEKSVLSVVGCSWVSYENSYGAEKLYRPQSVADPQSIVCEFTNTNTRQGRLHVVW